MGTTTFNFPGSGSWQNFNVPPGVTILTITMTGGGASASQGGRVKGKLKVKETDQLRILVGERGNAPSGKNGGNGTAGGGGKGGDGGDTGRPGGSAGGGGTFIRLNSNDGRVLLVAGGAGGNSGSGGVGGAGGGPQGDNGTRDGGGGGNVATGGTQSKGGNGGTIGANPNFSGENAGDQAGDRGGAGGQAGNDKAEGGGGGGGGYRAGGGGQAGKAGTNGWPGGGGGGGSSYIGEMYDLELNDKQGGTGHGSVTITWQDFGDYPPGPPYDVTINGIEESDGMPTRSLNARIAATMLDDENSVTRPFSRLIAVVSTETDPSGVMEYGRVIAVSRYVGDYARTGNRSAVDIINQPANTRFWARLYAQDGRGQISPASNAISWYSARSPEMPDIVGPLDRTEYYSDGTITFKWTADDPDRDLPNFPETQSAWAIRYRTAATVTSPPGDWVQFQEAGAALQIARSATTFAPGYWYEWQVAVADPSGLWSPWSEGSTFKVNAIALPPFLISPGNDNALYGDSPITFLWSFRTLLSDERQTRADLRYRPVGGGPETWQTITGDEITPGSGPRWTIAANTFNEGVHYEYQVRTHTTNGTTSEWSLSLTFWSASRPGGAIDPVPIDFTRAAEALGEYDNRVYVYKRGGEALLGELTPLKDVTWSRKRDDMGACTLHMTEWSTSMRDFIRTLKPWAHELVVFRNGIRVFEGPITRLSGQGTTGLEIEAKDVMGYVYRRIARQGYNDSYQLVGDQQLGLKTVVHRATQIILNALIYDDPNVLPYLTPMHNYGDAIQSRSLKGYTKTAYEEIDDLAAHAGLDYAIIGRRIVLIDTHRPIGRLPEFRDGHFSSPPIVTVYGMAYATDSATTNNNGIYGLAVRRGQDWQDTGYVEMLNSQYGESDTAGAGQDTLTPEDLAALTTTLTAQAERNVAGRFPMPVVVRVPDNSTLSPDINLTINQLVPGVWAPLRATDGIIEASQWQKLDSMQVRQDDKGEKISVVMSPAPNGGSDPDADIGTEE